MPGGLIQLVAYGAQDIYLTGNPQITYFKTIYRRYTNFAGERIANTFMNAAQFGGTASVAIARNGDLLSKTYIRVTISGASRAAANDGSKWAWVKYLGHQLIRSVELTIGGQRIDYHTSDFTQLWYELSHDIQQERGYNILIGNTTDMTVLDTAHEERTLYIPLNFCFCKHIGQALPLIAMQYHDVKINVVFSELAPLVITTGFDPADLKLQITDIALDCEYIFLDTDERKRFAQLSHEMLIEQVQYLPSIPAKTTTNSIVLPFNHPVKELIWGVHPGKFTGSESFLWYHPTDTDAMLLIASKRFALALAEYDSNGELVLGPNNELLPRTGLSTALATMFNAVLPVAITRTMLTVDNISILGNVLDMDTISTPISTLFGGVTGRPTSGQGASSYDVIVKDYTNFGSYLDGTVNPMETAVLLLNGQDRFSVQKAAFFNYIQPLEHHSRTPADGINVYSFALKPEEHQPSGSLNFSRIDTALLNLQMNSKRVSPGSSVAIYSTNYNVLRVMSGMAGLAYSN